MLFVLALFAFVVGLSALVAVAAANSVEGQDHSRWTVWPILFLGAGLLMLCGAAVVTMVLFAWKSRRPDAVELIALGGGVLLVGPLGVLLVLLGLSVRDRYTAAETWKGHLLRVATTAYGYILVCGSPAIVFPPLIGLTFGALFGGLAYVRQSRDAQLLWLLTIPVEQGLPLAPELQTSGEAVGGRAGRTLLEIAAGVEAGQPLSRAMTHRDSLIPPPAVLAARVGEQTGTLAATLREAAVRAGGQPGAAAQGSYLTGLVTYFWGVIFLLLGVVWFCMYYIVPKYKMVFEDFDVALPDVSVLMINAADLIANWWFLGLPLVLTAFGLSVAAGECYRRGWQNLSLDWLTRWFPRLDTPDILRHLARAVATRTPLTDVLETVAQFHHRSHINQRLFAVLAQTESGRNPWEALQDQRLLTAGEVRLLQAAEGVGNLDWALRDTADRIERQRQQRLQWWVEVLRPWPVLILSLLAATFAAGMFLPLVRLLRELS